MNPARLYLGALALALTACEVHFEGETPEEMVSICQPVMFEDSPFTQCTAIPGEHQVGTDLAPPTSDRPYRSLRELSEALPDDDIVFAMNAGMYDDEGQPIGYFVEDGLRLTMLNENDGPGNFHLLPNGVFFGEPGGQWMVRDTQAFGDTVDERPAFATQSGPMLVVDGELHPAFDPDGESRKIRNAVGVDPSGRAHFIITEAPVSFGKLARYFRDVLNCRNALFLDGSVSAIWDVPKGRVDTGVPIGPMIVVRTTETEK